MGEEAAEHDRREAALAATPILQPNFKSSRVTQAQLDKFRDLHKRRLQLKWISKNKGNPKGNASKVGKACVNKLEEDHKSDAENRSLDVPNLSAVNKHNLTDEEVAAAVPKRRKKLHWGLEAKHRWERKANM
ncbi:hypothetical protein AXF42_Ash007405 [Apostasia shenzhenica]|uniref:Uncharacterized protein n=1 Tax=Apostasia shenzhenica TaxID=1088818 RepID=A0A2I0BA21_9ASPA|nr:hypothetical protein AXF42_Ash007405 [Apostasia shenzhenica]